MQYDKMRKHIYYPTKNEILRLGLKPSHKLKKIAMQARGESRLKRRGVSNNLTFSLSIETTVQTVKRDAKATS